MKTLQNSILTFLLDSLAEERFGKQAHDIFASKTDKCLFYSESPQSLAFSAPNQRSHANRSFAIYQHHKPVEHQTLFSDLNALSICSEVADVGPRPKPQGGCWYCVVCMRVFVSHEWPGRSSRPCMVHLGRDDGGILYGRLPLRIPHSCTACTAEPPPSSQPGPEWTQNEYVLGVPVMQGMWFLISNQDDSATGFWATYSVVLMLSASNVSCLSEDVNWQPLAKQPRLFVFVLNAASNNLLANPSQTADRATSQLRI